MSFLKRNFLWVAFAIALLASVFTLIRSEILGTPLCPMCWYIRIFLFPLAIILGIATFRKDYNVIPYTITLTTLGAIAAIAFIAKVLRRGETIFCASGECCKVPIIIPVAMLIVFGAIFLLLFLGSKRIHE